MTIESDPHPSANKPSFQKQAKMSRGWAILASFLWGNLNGATRDSEQQIYGQVAHNSVLKIEIKLSIQHAFASVTHLMGIISIQLMIYFLERTEKKTQNFIQNPATQLFSFYWPWTLSPTPIGKCKAMPGPVLTTFKVCLIRYSWGARN